MPPTPKDLAERIAVLETTVELGFKHLGERLDKIAEDLSDQGRTPPPADRSPPVPAPAFRVQFPSPATLVELGKVVGLLLPFLAAVWGVTYTAAQSGGSDGATQAVEEAVEHGEAVPVAMPPTIRVVPHPVPVVAPTEPEPPVVNDDLMPLP